MKKYFLSTLLLSLFVFDASATEGVKLGMDEQVRRGRLENGMSYYIKHAENPKQRAEFFIAHNVGSLQENNDQRGLAHFLEHMAFNGTKNYPDKGILNYLSSIGVRFGYNVNAYTSKDRTVYNVSNVPVIREGVIDSLLLIMHDWSYYISCEPEEIEAERGVIREEWRRGEEPRARMARKTAEYEYFGSKYAERDVIGDPNIINTFKRQTLIDFYHKWYRPDLQAIIVVGDIDVDVIEKKIKTIFSSIPKSENPTPKGEYPIPTSDKPVVGLITDPETGAIGVKMIFRQPYPAFEDRQCEQSYKMGIKRDILLELVKGRYSAAEKIEGAKFKRVIPVASSLFTCNYTLMLTALPHPKKVEDALTGTAIEIERIRKHGFAKGEFMLAKQKVVKSRMAAIEKQKQANNTALASVYVEHFTRNTPYMTPEQESKVFARLIAATTLEQTNNSLGELLPENNLVVVIGAPEADSAILPTKQRIHEIVEQVKAIDIAPMKSVAANSEPLFTEQLTVGKIVKSIEIPELAAVEWRLSNGAKVLWREMPETVGKSNIALYGYNDGGFAKEKNIEWLKVVQAYVRNGMGVKDILKNDLREMLFNYDASVMLSIDKEFSSISASSSKKDFEFMLQLLYLNVVKPNFGDDTFNKYAKQVRASQLKEKSAKTIFSDSAAAIKYDEHPWIIRATAEAMNGITAKQAREIFDRQFANASESTFYFAGNISASEAKPLIEKYIGSMPSTKPAKYQTTHMEMSRGAQNLHYVTSGASLSRATIERIYHSEVKYTAHNNATLKYLTYILGARYMKSVREEKGGTYYIGVKDEFTGYPGGYCQLIVNFETNPKLADMLLKEVQKGIEELAENGPTQKEIDEAMLYFKKVNLERKNENLKTPAYLVKNMHNYDITGVDLRADDQLLLSAITADHVQKLTKEILSHDNCFTSIFDQRE